MGSRVSVIPVPLRKKAGFSSATKYDNSNRKANENEHEPCFFNKHSNFLLDKPYNSRWIALGHLLQILSFLKWNARKNRLQDQSCKISPTTSKWFVSAFLFTKDNSCGRWCKVLIISKCKACSSKKSEFRSVEKTGLMFVFTRLLVQFVVLGC